MRSTFKILMNLKKGSEKPNGNVPLMCRLTVDGEIKQFSCKMDVPPRLWEVKTGRASGKSIEAQKIGSGELYSKEHSKRFKAENASLKLEQDKAKPENIRFTINGTDIFDWFKQKQKEFLHSIGINPPEQKNGKGLKL